MAEEPKAELKEEPKEESEKEAPKEEPKEEPKEAGKVEPNKEEVKEAPKETPKEENKEPPKELEEDAAADSRKKVDAGSVAMNLADSTMNVMPVFGGKLLKSFSDTGFQHLLAGSRASVGVKAGRYMFETKVVEQVDSKAKRVVRVGLALAGSSLHFSDGEDSIYFDADGFFVHGKKKKSLPEVRQKFTRGATFAVVLNLDASSPNVDTISAFVNGVRACQPQKLPEAFKGKALYPVVSYRSVTLQVNFGPSAECKLPFTCRMLADAAKDDVEVSSTKSGCKREVLFPVGLPDQGVFDWADDFLAKNPSYTELSARTFKKWAMMSGVSSTSNAKGYNDAPDMSFDVPGFDNMSIVSMAKSFASYHDGNYLVLELKSNLLAQARTKALAQFPGFKKRAAVLMGEPNAEYKEAVQAILLSHKIQAEKKEAGKKRAAEEARKKLEAAKKARLAKQVGEVEPPVKAEEEKAPEPEPEEPEAPVTLTDAEKAIVFRMLPSPDLAPDVLNKVYADFSIPAKDEGFDAVDFLWQDETASCKHLKDYILQRKLTSRCDDLKPGEWFKKEWKEWVTLLAGWKKRQNEWKNPAQKKALLAKIAAEKKAKAKAEAGEGDETKEATEEAAELPKIDASDIDVFSVEDVNDIGSGEPLYANFAYEDWALLSLRYELHLLVHAFQKDLNDPDRPGFHAASHIGFYFNKYFNKSFSGNTFGCKSFAAVVDLVKEHASLTEIGLLKAVLPDDAPCKGFVQVVEEHRRDRSRRVDAGDETAELKFQRTPQAPSAPPQRPGTYQGQAPHGGQKRSIIPAAAASSGGLQPWTKQPRVAYQPPGGILGRYR